MFTLRVLAAFVIGALASLSAWGAYSDRVAEAAKGDSETKAEQLDEAEEAAQRAEAKALAAAEAEVKAKEDANRIRWNSLVVGLAIFTLAIFVGFEVIAKVPPTLHTPLMSGSNAISGITVVGAITIAGFDIYAGFWQGFGAFIGMIAVALAMVNVVGGFLVTHRMLAMFKRR